MGTVFAAPHEKDLCAPRLNLSATVEILHEDGGLVVSIPVNNGNFYADATGFPPATYKARVVTSQGTRTMVTAQTNGDCNSCHTAEGLNGAPGRIYLP
jgi:mono/diheme cytochrome c family protein